MLLLRIFGRTWRASFRVHACIGTMTPAKTPSPTFSRRERESVPQSSCARAFMENLLDNEIAHWNLEPKLVQLRNFADRLDVVKKSSFARSHLRLKCVIRLIEN